MTELTTTDLTWFVIMVGYFALIFLTFLPTLRAYMKNVGDVKLVMSLDQIVSNKLTEDELDQVQRNFGHMAGALKYWNKQVRQAKFFHFYALIWTTVGTILVPLLLPYVGQSGFAQTLITIISLHTALLLAFHRLLKPDRTFQGFRQIESGYYDLIRDMLDRPNLVKDAGVNIPLIDQYIEKVKQFRVAARRMETQESFPALDTSVAAAAAQQVTAGQGGVSFQAASQQVATIREQAVTTTSQQFTTVTPVYTSPLVESPIAPVVPAAPSPYDAAPASPESSSAASPYENVTTSPYDTPAEPSVSPVTGDENPTDSSRTGS